MDYMPFPRRSSSCSMSITVTPPRSPTVRVNQTFPPAGDELKASNGTLFLEDIGDSLVSKKK